MKSFKALILAIVMLCGTAHALEDIELYGQGLPLPWPFPWAKDCPVDWKAMEGRYVLSESVENQEIDLDITVQEEAGNKVVHVAHFTRDGQMLAEGTTTVTPSQRAISLYLMPKQRRAAITWASIQMHFQGKETACTEDNLVPILTLQQIDSPNHAQMQYRLMKLSRRH